MAPRYQLAVLASLVNPAPRGCGLSLEQVGSLTDAQIYQLYFHPRDSKTGGIRFPVLLEQPVGPLSLEEELKILEKIARSCRTPADKLERLKAKLRAKHASNA